MPFGASDAPFGSAPKPAMCPLGQPQNRQFSGCLLRHLAAAKARYEATAPRRELGVPSTFHPRGTVDKDDTADSSVKAVDGSEP